MLYRKVREETGEYLVLSTLKASFCLYECIIYRSIIYTRACVCACEQVGSLPDRKKPGDGEEGKEEAEGDREV